MINKVIQGDCLDVLRKMDSDSIDLTVTSPPYDNLRTYNGYSFDFENIAKELYRVTKKGGVVVWVVGDATVKGSETGTSFKQALYFKEVGFNLHDTMIYVKKNPMPQVKTLRYTQSFEYMFVLSKGKPTTCNYITDVSANAGKPNRTTNRVPNGKIVQGVSYGKPVRDTKIRRNVWEFTVGGGITSDKYAFEHPAMFPEQLAHDHIISWSNEGDTVLDIFGGSGTTAKMAVLNNRNYIHIDISEEYCKLAQRRIDDALLSN